MKAFGSSYDIFEVKSQTLTSFETKPKTPQIPKISPFKVGVEGAGFEPTVDALFGEKGFFSESISRLMHFLGDKAPMLKEVLDRISPHQERMKRQVGGFSYSQHHETLHSFLWLFHFKVTEDHLKAFKGIFQKLLQDVRLSEAPEATAYLRLLGEEIGYLKTSEMRNILEGFSLYYHIFIRVLPAQVRAALSYQLHKRNHS